MGEPGIAEVERAVAEVARSAAADGKSAVTIAFVDPNGDLRLLHRMDGAARRTLRIAVAKAYTAALFDRETGALKERLLQGGDDLAWFADPGFTALPGGLPVRRAGRLVGAVGVSGRLSHEDVELARIAQAALEGDG
jgi:glc operon protein GlcG